MRCFFSAPGPFFKPKSPVSLKMRARETPCSEPRKFMQSRSMFVCVRSLKVQNGVARSLGGHKLFRRYQLSASSSSPSSAATWLFRLGPPANEMSTLQRLVLVCTSGLCLGPAGPELHLHGAPPNPASHLALPLRIVTCICSFSSAAFIHSRTGEAEMGQWCIKYPALTSRWL